MGLLHPAHTFRPSYHHYPPCISHWLCIQIEIYATAIIMCTRLCVCVGGVFCFLASACAQVREHALCASVCGEVMRIVLSSLGCIHCPSHGSMYRWGCNYVPQWSSLCFFTAEELSRQRSVCAPRKLPAENHMAMRAIMDFFPSSLRAPSSLPRTFFSLFRLLSMNIWADVNRCALPATSVFALQQAPKLSLLCAAVVLEKQTDTGACVRHSLSPSHTHMQVHAQ